MPLNSTARRAGAAAFALLTGLTAISTASATEPTTQPEATDAAQITEGSAAPAPATTTERRRARDEERAKHHQQVRQAR